MSTRAQQAQLLKNTTFFAQVQGSLIYTANNVINEGTSADNHENRLKWARAIFSSPDAQTEFFLPGMLTNSTIAAEAADPTTISDGDVDYVVSSLFNTYANQYALQFNLGATLSLGS
jgi:hypothetical protein